MTDDLSAAKSIAADAIRIPSRLERIAFLEKACGSNHGLIELVSTLLGAFDDTVGVERCSDLVAMQVQDTGVTAPLDRRGESSLLRAEATFPQVPGFEIIELLGRGGMGVVYKARQLKLKRIVALKMIRGDDLQDVELTRFRAEAESVARLQHPNIVQIYEVGEHLGRPYFALEFVDGVTLADHSLQQRMSQRDAAEIVEALAHAMHYAHQQGVIHRDLKPSNVLVAAHPASRSPGGKSSDWSTPSHSKSSVLSLSGRSFGGAIPKIADFGLAKQLDVDSDLTRTGAVVGTPSYMAPEQAAGSHDVGALADVYSLGAILYAMLTQQPPFRGNTAVETVMKVRDEDPVRPRKIDPRIDKDLENICLKCLSKAPSQRYQEAEHLADDLRRYLNGDPVRAIAPSLVYRFTKFCKRHRGGVFASTVSAITVIAGLIAGIMYQIAARDRDLELASLADAKLLAELNVEHRELTKLNYRDRHAAMQRWLDRWEQLGAKLDLHRATLRNLPSDGRPKTQVRRDELSHLVRGIEALAGSDGARTHVLDWIGRTPSSDQIDQAWKAVIASVEPELGFKPAVQPGLYPQERDHLSHLWEFVDLNTGLAIQRDPDGRLVLREDSGIVYVLVPGGRFMMGSPADEPDRSPSEYQHPVFVGSFLISKYELMQSQWVRVMGQNPSQTVSPMNPVDSVSWVDCVEFCNKTGSRLPTEAQWEYACRSGTSGMYSGDQPLDQIAWYRENSEHSTHRLGDKLPNAFGLFDVHGNLLEWCQDVFAEDFYQRLEATGRDPVNLAGSGEPEMHRALRGGSFEGVAHYQRCADRYHEKQNMRWRGFGLRPARPVD